MFDSDLLITDFTFFFSSSISVISLNSHTSELNSVEKINTKDLTPEVHKQKWRPRGVIVTRVILYLSA